MNFNYLNPFSFRNPYLLFWWYGISVLLCLSLYMRFGIVALGSLGMLGLVWPAYFTYCGYYLARELRHRGFEWVHFGMGISLTIRFQAKGWSLPHRDQLASVPGFEDTFDGLCRVITSSHDMPDYNGGLNPVQEVAEWVIKNGRLRTFKLHLSVRLLLSFWSILIASFLLLLVLTAFNLYTGWKYSWSYSAFGLLSPLWMMFIGLQVPGWLKKLNYGDYTMVEGIIIGFQCQHRVCDMPERNLLDEILVDPGQYQKNGKYDPRFLTRVIQTEANTLKKMNKNKSAS